MARLLPPTANRSRAAEAPPTLFRPTTAAARACNDVPCLRVPARARGGTATTFDRGFRPPSLPVAVFHVEASGETAQVVRVEPKTPGGFRVVAARLSQCVADDLLLRLLDGLVII